MLRPFYFLVVFWGEEYRDYFLDYCLASLLSDNNIPILENKEFSKLLICTTEDDWVCLQTSRNFRHVKSLIEIQWLNLNLHEHKIENRDHIMLVMSKGHRILSSTAYKAGAYGVFLYPEMIIGDGAIGILQKLAHSKKYDVVKALGVRFANEGLLKELETRGIFKKNHSLSISNRELVEITLKHIHSETRRMNWNAAFVDNGIGAVYFPAVSNKAIQFHTANFAPLLIDYSKISNHDTSTFDTWTLDGDYIHRNFSNIERIYLIQDSDELMVVGFTDENKCRYSLEISNRYKYWPFNKIEKIISIRRNIFKNITMDRLKVKLFLKPIKIHCCDVNKIKWVKSEICAALYFKLAQISIPKIVLRKAYSFIILISKIFSTKQYLMSRGYFANFFEENIAYYLLKLNLEDSSDQLYWEVDSNNIGLDNGLFSSQIKVGLNTAREFKKKSLNDGFFLFGNGNLAIESSGCNVHNSFASLGRTFRFAWQRKLGFLWFGVDNNWLNGGDPEKNENPTFTSVSSRLYPTIIIQGKKTPIQLRPLLSAQEWKYIAPEGYNSLLVCNGNSVPYEIVTNPYPLKLLIQKISRKIYSRLFSRILRFTFRLAKRLFLALYSYSAKMEERL